ncbi:MAG TPA: hypothetical protein VF592_13420 [Sphingomonas sp.]|jgi:hypothetical protein|uniref:hypothetical protein n=1 Tax=Sphingomonas sp. TaxID=28214 RepID=UPI002ED7FF46
MVATHFRLNMIPPIGGAATGVILALVTALMPAATVDALVVGSGLSGLAAAAGPPIGATGRLLLAIALGGMAGAIAWAALFLLFGAGGLFAREGGRDGMPQVRRADAHPDAPPRKPLSAADLSRPAAPDHDVDASDADGGGDGDGGPLPIAGPAAPIERPIPADLDQPLAEFDPRAIPAQPMAPSRPVPPLAVPAATVPIGSAKPAPLAPGERIDSFEITPRHAAEVGAPSIEALLARLERGTMLRQRQMSRAG